MNRSLFGLAMMAAVMLAAPLSAGHGCDGADGCGCHVECPQCHHYCELSVDKVKVDKYCWEVECKPICIPRVHFPWECGCPPKCAKVKQVNVLKKKTYECEACRYSWSPVPESCGCAGASCCDDGCAGTVNTGIPTQAQPEPVADANTAPELTSPMTGQRPTWFDSVKAKSKLTVALPVQFFRAAAKRD